MRVFRRVILPTAFLAVFLVIAVALAWMAFRPSEGQVADAVDATGALVDPSVVVERGTIENTVELDGTISRDPAIEARAPEAGVVNHFFVSAGDTVAAGAELYQIRTTPDSPGGASGDEGGADEDTTDESTAAPRERPVYRTVRAEQAGVVGPIDTTIDDEVAKGDAVVQVRPESFTATASLEPAMLYRLQEAPDKATVEVEGGPEPFECTRLRVDDAGGGSGNETDAPDSDSTGTGDAAEPPADGGGGDDSTAAARCTVPRDVRVFDGLSLTLTIDAGSAEDVLVVPVTAVRGQTDEASVWVVDETGEGKETRVELGLNDGTSVEVTRGLDEGQEIMEFVPGSEPEDPSGGEYGFSDEGGEVYAT